MDDPGPESDSPREGETLDTIELVRSAQAGELPAFDRLFERYYATVHEYVRRRLGRGMRRYLDSRDILNDAMIQAIRSFERFEIRSDRGFMSWLCAIVENQIRSALRRERAVKRDRASEVALEHVNSAMSTGTLRLEPAARDDSPLEEMKRKEEARVLLECLDELEEQPRRIIELRHRHEMPWGAIADEVGSPSADAARMVYARASVELGRSTRRRTGEEDG